MFLRKHMDSQGFVFLSVLEKFNRIKQLTSDNELIRWVCLQSPTIDFQAGPDGLDRVRRAHGWQQWVLSMEDRDESARNDGPSQLQQPQFSMFHQADHRRGSYSRNTMSPTTTLSMNQQSTELPTSNGNGIRGHSQVNDSKITQTPLSAAVPDFTPSLQPLGNPSFQPLEIPVESENTFSDQQVDNLMIIIGKPGSRATPIQSPIPVTSPGAISNGALEQKPALNDNSNRRMSDRSTGSPINGDHLAGT